MNKKTVFVCEYCGRKFENEAYCKRHEEIHIEDFSKKSSKEISCRLYQLLPIDSFSSLMREAAQRLRKVEDEN